MSCGRTGDLLAVNDETVFQCLPAGLDLIIMQTAAALADVMAADGKENERVHSVFRTCVVI